MDNTKALQKLLNGTATKKEVELLKRALASGEISIGRDVNRSVVIIGSGNKVELTSEAIGILKPETTIEEPIEGDSPYMGLRYFDTSDASLFFGRESLTRELSERIIKENFLAIVGASGSGKSSVARAGLIPAWTKENKKGLVHVITPTANPLESLAAGLTRNTESVTATSTLMDDLQKDSRSLRLYVRKLLSNSGETNFLLVVDQFEETFTLCKDLHERKLFIENLLSLTDEKSSTARVIITLRADFYHYCAKYDGLRLALEKHQTYIGAMTPDELREAIVQPADKNGWDFQPGLVDLILQDVGTEPGALPLLSHALLETWKRRQGHTLTLKGYHEAGGVKKAIAHTAENVYDHLSPEEQSIARSIFLLLTELGEGVQDTRRRVKMDELSQSKEQESVAKVLKTLTDARLVTTEQDSAEVAHEALIREWATLRKWLDEDRESLRLHRHLAESAREWQRRGREASELYRGTRLKQIDEWVKEHSEQLSSLEAEFMKASQNVKRKERYRLATFASASVVFLLLAILGATGKLNSFIYRPIDMDSYWATIPAGEFLMGSDPSSQPQEQPQHWVYLDTYQIGKYETTYRQYAQCLKAGICRGASDIGKENDLLPVIAVTWFDANTYCEWAGGRLPTEAEWEKAASWDVETRTKFVYPWGNNDPFVYRVANNDLVNYSGYFKSITPVGTYPSGENGLYDMAGNVWEWVNDWYQSDYYATLGDKSSNPQGPASGDSRVMRGGSWADDYLTIRSATRGKDYPANPGYYRGFRCARDIPQ